MEPVVINELPFLAPSRDWRDFLTLEELTEGLILLKHQYEIFYPDDNYINLACNILESMPDKTMLVAEWLDKNRK